MKDTNLIFIANELLEPELLRQMNLPLEFISFAITDGKFYPHFKNNGWFYIPLGRDTNWGNSKVYGAIYLVRDYFFYIGILDAYHACSKSNLTYNHIRDIHHRVDTLVTPITFNSLSELSSLKYKEKTDLTVVSYIGNIKHPKINRRFSTSENYRKVNGIYEEGFKNLFREVVNEKE